MIYIQIINSMITDHFPIYIFLVKLIKEFIFQMIQCFIRLIWRRLRIVLMNLWIILKIFDLNLLNNFTNFYFNILLFYRFKIKKIFEKTKKM